MYKLTETDIKTGHLSEDAINAYACKFFKLKTYPVGEFKHYHDLMRYQTLSKPKFEERANDICSKILGSDLMHNGNFDKDTAKFLSEEASSQSGSALCTNVMEIETPNDDELFSLHFDLINEQGFEKAHTPDSDIWIVLPGIHAGYVFPGILSEEIEIPIDKCYIRANGIMLTTEGLSPREFWEQESFIPGPLLDTVPDDGAIHLINELHELRHYDQIIPQPKAFDDILTFYSEMDADWAADASLIQAGIGEESRIAKRQARYIAMLSEPNLYWFAATLDALQAGEKPKNYFETFGAVLEIRLRIALKDADPDYSRFSSRDFQDAIAHTIEAPGHRSKELLSENARTLADKAEELNMAYEYRKIAAFTNNGNPATILTDLRILNDEGLFEGLAHTLADRIISAAAYFNPDLVHNDDPDAHARMQQRMLAAARVQVTEPKTEESCRHTSDP